MYAVKTKLLMNELRTDTLLRNDPSVLSVGIDETARAEGEDRTSWFLTAKPMYEMLHIYEHRVNVHKI